MAKTKEAVYQEQMTELGIWDPIFAPELKMLARLERELTRAQKEWSSRAVDGRAPSFTDEIYPVIQKLRSEILQHREALGLTPKALAKLKGKKDGDAVSDKELITSKLDRIAARVSEYDAGADWWKNDEAGAPVPGLMPDPFNGISAASSAAALSDLMDDELRKAVHDDMG